jgi:ectoine hydroxylase-related dioxygenase (phytanoyl-CoA dioxygenase family)
MNNPSSRPLPNREAEPCLQGSEEKDGALPSTGYRILRDILSGEEIDALRAAVLETFDRVARSLLAPFDTSCPGEPLEDRLEKAAQKDRAYTAVLLQAALADTQRDSRIAALAEHAGLSERVRELIAPLPVSGHTLRVRVSLPTLVEQRSPWHQDVTRPPEGTVPSRGCESVRLACWMPLSDADENSGALEVLPGRWSEPLPHRPVGDGRHFIAEEDLPARPRVVLPVRRGDVLVLDRFLPHRALPVRHGRARWAVVMWVKSEMPPC